MGRGERASGVGGNGGREGKGVAHRRDGSLPLYQHDYLRCLQLSTGKKSVVLERGQSVSEATLE